ncbi:condensation domain-containing protein [Plantactinospora sp. KLBMP9567]|uniref:condensation domain-containing protein n=1 Tax=Plantactinospora sp. KLBMP9567 TaxID=3085900 RepID=UPI002981E886|nr:condensation domain-containing protein [Plantactinospora sp. KLBMP9567]MDW5324833.1 condensation domain-containing protein [Plantactinospora sp. KLBMP9567]
MEAVEGARRSGPLGAGQVFEWWKFRGSSRGSIVWLRLPLPRPVPEVDVRAAVTGLVARHEALRSTVGYDERGLPRQLVHPPGEREVFLGREPYGLTGDEIAAWVDRFDFDVERHWPCWGLLLHADDGDVAELVLFFSHVSMDAVGTLLLHDELAELLLARWERRPHRLPPVRRHLLDAVALDSSPELDAERAEAERYWAAELRAAPSRLFGSTPHTSFRLYAGTIVSTTAPEVLAAAARRYRTTPAALYSAVVTILLAILSGADRSVLRFHYHGRGPAEEGVVGCFHRILFTSLDVSDRAPLGKLVRRAATQILRAQRQYRIGWDRLAELEAAEILRRGTGFAWGSTVNFGVSDEYERLCLRGDYGPATLDGLPEPEIMLNPREISDNDTGMDAYLMVRIGRDSMHVQGGFNGNILLPGEMEVLLRGPERVLRQALRRHDLSFAELVEVATGIAGQLRPPGCWLGNRLTDLDQLRKLLEEHPDVRAAYPWVEPTPDGERLVAFLAVGDTGPGPAELRDFVLARIGPTAAVTCPEHFVTYARPPLDRDDPSAWRALPRLAEGTGLRRAARAATGDRELALHRAVTRFTGATELSMAGTYLETTGRLLVVPAILRALADEGYTGLLPDDFVRPVSLAQLATELTAPPLGDGPGR